MTVRMLDGAKTTTRNARLSLVATYVAAMLGLPAGHAATPALQELAGATREAATRSQRDTPGERHEPTALPILFPAGSARLTPSATRLLDEMGSLAGSHVRIEAHGGRDRDLAGRRAAAVAGYLRQNCGLAAAAAEIATAASPDDRRVLVVRTGS